jgi:hypothetical protein
MRVNGHQEYQNYKVKWKTPMEEQAATECVQMQNLAQTILVPPYSEDVGPMQKYSDNRKVQIAGKKG